MKKLFLTLFILILCCSLLGCSIYDKTDSEFTGKSDDSAASSNGGSGESGDGLGDAAPQPVTSTDEELSGEYYVGDGFRFVVPSVWRVTGRAAHATPSFSVLRAARRATITAMAGSHCAIGVSTTR